MDEVERSKRRARPFAVALFFVALTVSVGFLVGRWAGDGSAREWLLSFGGAAELFGLLLIASPELAPVLQRVAAAALAGWKRVVALLHRAERLARRLLRRPRHHVVGASSNVLAHVGLSASGRVGPPRDASTERILEYLLERDQRVQDALEDFRLSLQALPDEWKRDIDAATVTLRDEHTRELEQMRDRHMHQRLLGVALLAAGILLATAGNLA